MTSLDPEERCVALNVEGVEVATLNMGSVNFFEGVYVNTPSDIELWANRMKKKKIIPELCIFEAGMIENVKKLELKNLLGKNRYYNFSLGFPGAMPATLNNLILLIDSIPQNSPWFYVEHGLKNFMPVVRAISMNGHVRAGFEDNVYLDENTKASSNHVLVEKVSNLAVEMGRKIVDAAKAREILGLKG